MDDTILIVEDHSAIRNALKQWLKLEFPRVNIIDAATGEDAVNIVKAITPDLVLMDISLPGMNGIEATRQITSTSPSSKVIILSVYDDVVYRAKAASAGISAYVPKRLMNIELIPTMKKLMGGGKRVKDTGCSRGEQKTIGDKKAQLDL